MANPLDRTWFDTLVDDTGDGLSGTIWNKAAVDALMDTVDASLAGVVDRTAAAAGQIAVFGDADTLGSSALLTADLASGGVLIDSPAGFGYAYLSLRDLAQAADAKTFRIVNNGGVCYLVALDDVGASPVAAWIASRTGDVTVGRYLTVTGGQVKFPVAVQPTADPTTMDDYREVVPWVPSLTGTGGGSGTVYSAQLGWYTKIGGEVFCKGRLGIASAGTISGNVRIAGFPHAMHAGAQFWASGCISYIAGLALAVSDLKLFMYGGTSVADLVYMPAAGGTGHVPLAPANVGSMDIMFSLNYPAP